MLALLVDFVFGPVGEGFLDADEFFFRVAGQLAEGAVYINDAALHVGGAQAGQHRFFHRLAEGGFGAPGVLGGLAVGHVVRYRVDHTLARHRVGAPYQPLVAVVGALHARLEGGGAAFGEQPHLLARAVEVVRMYQLQQLPADHVVGGVAEDALEGRVEAAVVAVQRHRAQHVERQVEDAVAFLLHLDPPQHVAALRPQAPEHQHREADDQRYRQRARQLGFAAEGSGAQREAVARWVEHDQRRQ